MSKDRKAVFVISVAAELAGMHPQTLRIWERRGLVDPFRTPGGTRRYSQADLDRLALIQELTDQGLNLEGVKRVLAMQKRIAALEQENAELYEQMVEERSTSADAVRQVHRSYRREIVVRKPLPPDIRR